MESHVNGARFKTRILELRERRPKLRWGFATDRFILRYDEQRGSVSHWRCVGRAVLYCNRRSVRPYFCLQHLSGDIIHYQRELLQILYTPKRSRCYAFSCSPYLLVMVEW